jgi:hypothetical protein
MECPFVHVVIEATSGIGRWQYGGTKAVCQSVLELMKEMADIIPPGVVSVITGDGEDVVQALVAHPQELKSQF